MSQNAWEALEAQQGMLDRLSKKVVIRGYITSSYSELHFFISGKIGEVEQVAYFYLQGYHTGWNHSTKFQLGSNPTGLAKIAECLVETNLPGMEQINAQGSQIYILNRLPLPDASIILEPPESTRVRDRLVWARIILSQCVENPRGKIEQAHLDLFNRMHLRLNALLNEMANNRLKAVAALAEFPVHTQQTTEE